MPAEKPTAPIPTWQSQLESAIALGAQRATEAAVEPLDLCRWMESLARIERDALELAAAALRAEGLIPTVPAGTKLWLELATKLAKHIRERIGVPEDPR